MVSPHATCLDALYASSPTSLAAAKVAKRGHSHANFEPLLAIGRGFYLGVCAGIRRLGCELPGRVIYFLMRFSHE